jgi:predicted GNAT family N-acyltransferase
MDNVEIKSFEMTDVIQFSKAMNIRTQVFVHEQKVDEFLEFDGYDKYARHYLLYEDDKAVATARCRNTEEGIKLERFAVYKDFRGKGYGKMLLEILLKDILPTPKLIYLHAQSYAVSFYKPYGFDVIGKMFLEVDIEHYMMIYKRKKS